MYSARADDLQRILRFWLLAVEIAPVVVKFVNSLLPRRAYAEQMFARDEEARRRARADVARIRSDADADVAIARRASQLRVEVEGATAELGIREAARQARRFRLPWIRDQFERAVGATRSRRAVHVIDLDESGVLPEAPPSPPVPGPRAAPGLRVINNEDFL
ncbi:hypothetical protein [Pseudofrankia sp. DC12]|uniref:hypothetical protein n=1 Tax=Pseudofrankia sp. DC12 TaxID=683315 RepID=UPI0005F81D6E|nr:hypothetical protein [Pseudofrankia sp. DC12]